jgi:predicted RNA-binding protein with PUA-like domain
MAEQAQQFWAFCSNPEVYRIEDAVAEVEFDNWVTKGSEIHAGDRAIIWKTKGHSDWSGVVALAEIVANPAPAPDLHPEYQQYPPPPHHVGPLDEMVTIRYLSASTLPLRLDGPYHDLLSSLSIVRGGARRSVYHIEPEQWAALIDVLGGWPCATQRGDVQAVTKMLYQQAGKRRAGQGFQRDAEVRRAVERRAMELAEQHYRQAGWQVEDVSALESYDLVCRRLDGQELRVEVKGTTGEGSQILLTANEVAHARARFPEVALCIVANVRVSLTAEGTPVAQDGDLTVIEPWQVEESALTPVTFTYSVRRL